MRDALTGVLKLSLVLVLASATIFPAAAAAGALTSASLTFNLGGAGDIVFPATGVTGTGMSVAEVTVDAGSGFAGTVVTPLDAPPASAQSVIIGSNTLGNLLGDPLTSTNLLVNSTSIILGFGGTPLITIPLAAGSTTPVSINEGGVQIDIYPFGWTSGVLQITDATNGMGGGAPVATATGSVVEGTPGSVTMVSGAYIETSLADPTFQIYTLTMEFERLAPEPAGLLILSVGGLALAARARRRTI